MTLSTDDIAEALRSDENANWSRMGAYALAEYLEEMEEDTGEEMELDVVALRCDFSEYESLEKWAEGYFLNGIQDDALNLRDGDGDITAGTEEIESAIRDYIQDNGQLIQFDGGIIVSSF